MVVTALIGATRLLRPEPTALPVKLLLVPMVLLAAATAVDAVVTPRALGRGPQQGSRRSPVLR